MRTCTLFLAFGLAWGETSGSSPNRIRAAAQEALRLIQASQRNWYANRSCSSCHHQFLPALAFQDAREHGLSFDSQAAHADAAKSFGQYADLDRAVQYPYIIEPALDEGFRLVAAHAAGVRPSLVTAIYARHLAVRQAADGHWDTTDNRPPLSYSTFTATAISMRAVQLYSHSSLSDNARAITARAKTWLRRSAPGNTEDRVFQILGLLWAGAERPAVRRFADELAALQRADGGWNSRDGLASEAYSTGEALVALVDSGALAPNSAVFERGIDFLLRTQQSDGSWHVVSRLHPPPPSGPPYFETGYPYEHDQFISMAGACWGVMALSRALGAPHRSLPPALAEASPKNLEPWPESVLFGSLKDLRRMLDKGFDPNTATKAGGVTALMMAVPDREKASLLLDRGAGVNVRSKIKFSPLLVSALYPGSSPMLRLLLDHGAEMQLPKGAGRPLFNATPTVFAFLARDPQAIRLLNAAGDHLDEKFVFLGQASSDVVDNIMNLPGTALLETVLDLGVPVDRADEDGDTLLISAVLSGHPELVRFLIERGAKVSLADKLGMTALHYAAARDFGDASVVELLLRNGAVRDARNKEGLTALELARKYDHSYLFPALAPSTASH